MYICLTVKNISIVGLAATSILILHILG